MNLIRPGALAALFLLMFASWRAMADAAAAPIIDLGAMDEGELLGRHMTYVDDASGTWTLSDILAKDESLPYLRGQQDVLNLGFSTAAVWLRLTLNNPESAPRTYFLEYGYPVIDHLAVYNEVQGRWQERRAGDKALVPAVDLFENRNPSFAITVPPGQSRIFLQIKGEGALQVQVKLWSKEALQTHMLKEYTLLSMIYGVFLVMMLYNLLLCLWFRSVAYFYYVLFIAASTLNLMNLQGFSVILFPRELGIFLSNKLGLFANCGIVLGLSFGRLFLDMRASSPRIDRVLRGLTLFSLLSIAISAVSYNIGVKLFMLQTFVVSFALLGIGVYRSVQGYRPAYFFTLSWTFVLAGHLLYQLALVGLFPFSFITSFGPFIGSAVEIVLLSLAMGDKMRYEQQTSRREIARLFNDLKIRNEEISSLNQHLEKLVEEKTRNIRSILKHIRQGIFMIGADRKIMNDTSDYLHDIFDESQVEGRDAFEVLFQKSGVSADQVNQSETAIEASFDEPVLAFDLNQHLLCHEWSRINGRGETRILECDWNPMTKDGVTDKILVTVKDVTEHRVLERKNKEQEEVLKIIGEIINVETGMFRRFVQQSKRLLSECQQLSAGSLARDERLLRRIFVNLHTLKGTARSLFLSNIADGAHQLEQRLQKAIDDEAAYQSLNLADELKHIEALLGRYVDTAQEKLGLHQIEVLQIPRGELESTLAQMEAICAREPVQPKELARLLDDHRRMFYQQLYTGFEKFCAGLKTTVSSVARELGKPTPDLNIRAEESFVLTPEGEELLGHIFVHILRNAVDHGMESRELRLQQGKPEQGRIDVTFRVLPHDLAIDIADDGQGLHLNELTQRALNMGLIEKGYKLSEQECVDLIFKPGFSTRDQVSLVSGRGVGMDAVKTYVEENGGHIKLTLTARKPAEGERRSFMLCLQLPRTFIRMLQATAPRLAS